MNGKHGQELNLCARHTLFSTGLAETRQESADSSGARACGTQDKASKPASNLSEPTCKAATRVEVSPAKLQPITSPKPKPAAGIEQSSNGAIESNFQIEPSKLQGFPMGPSAGCRGPANFLAGQLLNIIKTSSKYDIIGKLCK